MFFEKPALEQSWSISVVQELPEFLFVFSKTSLPLECQKVQGMSIPGMSSLGALGTLHQYQSLCGKQLENPMHQLGSSRAPRVTIASQETRVK